MIGRADEDVVDVEQESAAGAARDLAQEIGLGECAFGEDDVGRGVFEQDRPPQRGLHLVDMVHDASEGFEGVGQGQEIVEEGALVGRPRQVLGNERRLEALRDRRQPLEMRLVQRPRRADRQADAVQRQRVTLADGVEAAMRRAARAHVVFRVDLEKPKLRARFHDRLEVLGLESDADAPAASDIDDRRWSCASPRPRCSTGWRLRLRWRAAACYIGRLASFALRVEIFSPTCNGRPDETKAV